MLNREEEYNKMQLAEGQLWWYRILHEQVLSTLQSTFKSKEIKILDAGCGTGGLLKFLGAHGYVNMKGFDLSPFAVEANKRSTSFNSIAQLDIKEVSSFYAHDRFDVIICNDVLYFLSEIEFSDVLKSLLQRLNQDGVLMVNLPSYAIFKGMHDVSVGIKERWTFRRFKTLSKLVPTDYIKLEYFYWPMLLSPLILLVRLSQRMMMLLYPSKKITSDVSIPSPVINKLFYIITKCERYLPFRKVIGSSLFITIYR